MCAGNAPVSAAAAAAAAGSVNVTGTTNSNAAVGSQSKDYSAQWVKYYRSIGKHEEADNLEKQIKVRCVVKIGTIVRVVGTPGEFMSEKKA